MENEEKEKTQIVKNNSQKSSKNKKKIKKLSETSRYFDFYDDVKAGCHKIVDW